METHTPVIVDFVNEPTTAIHLDGTNESFNTETERNQEIITAERTTANLFQQLSGQNIGLVRSATKFKEGGTVSPEALTTTELLYLIRTGVGVDNLDIPALAAQGVLVTNTPKATTEAVGQHAFSLTLALMDRITLSDQKIAQEAFVKEKREALYGKTVLIVGSGNIGVDAASKFAAFGAKVLLYDVKPKDAYFAPAGAIGSWGNYRGNEGPNGIKIHSGESTLEALMIQADVISFHTPDVPKPVLGAQELKLLQEQGKKPYIVNTGRHTALDTQAVLLALKEGHLRGVGLDVFPQEKKGLPSSQEGKTMAGMRGKFNLATTAHMAGNTIEGQQNTGIEAAEYATRLRAGRVVGFGVNVQAAVPEKQVRLSVINRNEAGAHNAITGQLAQEGLNIETRDSGKQEWLFGGKNPTDFNVIDIRNGDRSPKELARFVRDLISKTPSNPIVKAWISAGE